MTREEAKNWLNKLYARADITDEYGDAEDMQPYEEAIDMAIKALEQEPKTWNLDNAREDFMSDVYDTLDFLPTNNEANRIIDSFDRVTSDIRQEPILEKIRAEIIELRSKQNVGVLECLDILDKYKAESEEI